MTRYVLALVLALITAAPANGQNEAGEKAPFPFPEAAPKKDWAWDKDKRFDELMEQLAINEASLDAVDVAIAKKTRKKGSQIGSSKRFDENNRFMDRKGGGPMNWREFYGTNAEKFFYHPVDPNTTYHTTTALQQIGKAQDDKTSSDIPTRQGLPVHQRPPQWDYIYRANRTASESALADAALLATEVEQLEQRRAQLEQEQAVFWCKLAFRAVQRIDMQRKTILRFQLIAAGDGNEENEQARALAAAAQFLSSALLIVEKAEEEQSVAMGSANTVVVEARERFEDALLEQPSLESISEDKGKPLGQFVALAKLLGDKSKTLSEAYAGAMDGAANNEAARKKSYRGMLQRTVIDYAQILLALNELADAMKKEWGVRVDTKTKLEGQTIEWRVSASVQGPVLPKDIARTVTAPDDTPKNDEIHLISKDSLDGWISTDSGEPNNWIVKDGVITLIAKGSSLISKQKFKDFDLHFEFALPKACNSGVFLRGRYELQLIDPAYRLPSGKELTPIGQLGAIWGQIPSSRISYRGNDKWNTCDVRLVNRNVSVRINKIVVIDRKDIPDVTQGALDKDENQPGGIMLQSQDITGVKFRDITVRPIK